MSSTWAHCLSLFYICMYSVQQLVQQRINAQCLLSTNGAYVSGPQSCASKQTQNLLLALYNNGKRKICHAAAAVRFVHLAHNVLSAYIHTFLSHIMKIRNRPKPPFFTFGQTKIETEMQTPKPKVNRKLTESTRGSKISRIFCTNQNYAMCLKLMVFGGTQETP